MIRRVSQDQFTALCDKVIGDIKKENGKPIVIVIADEAGDIIHMTHMDGAPARSGVIASGNYFVDSPEQIERVISLTHADAVEMEGAAVVHVAARNDVPALVIRAMSDNADTDYEEFRDFDISEYADTAARIAVTMLRRM